MALQTPKPDTEHLQAIVDMGSNGIRFSISSLQPPTARIMPTLYQHRVGISLYDAQYSSSGERQPIGDETMKAVIAAFKQFQLTCSDFGVPEKHITVLATEATRTAINSEDFRSQIRQAIGWEVKMMPKEEEGEVGAMGIASSLPEVNGLVMDLGGGSTQLSWLIASNDGSVRMPRSGAVSMPYGAAAMSRRLTEAERDGTVERLREEVQQRIKEAYDSLKLPDELKSIAERQDGFTLYLSGGGFRGWGYVLMSRHRVRPYPIPVINGFKASRTDFLGIEDVKSAAAAALQNADNEIFRVSDRRASQVPAVAFLIKALAEVLPQIKEVRFCQGGVREGYLFRSLDASLQKEHPLVTATRPFSPSSSGAVLQLLTNALPEGSTKDAEDDYKNIFTSDILAAFANLIYYHSTHSKDLQTSAALRSTVSGILAGVHGLLHEHRTILALLLCSRWGGEVPPTDEPFKKALEQLVECNWTLWWINYLGAVAALIANVYPAGIRSNQKSRLAIKARWDVTDKQRSLLHLQVQLSPESAIDTFAKELKDIEKTGKKKNWIDGKDGVGHKVEIETCALTGHLP